MPYAPEAIANYFIAMPVPPTDLTPMKIQKLVYFSHGWNLAIKGDPLIDEHIQAWEYGPVVERLYHALKTHGDRPVIEPILSLKAGSSSSVAIEQYAPSLADEPESRAFTEALLNKVRKNYGELTAAQLSRMTHQEGTPWDLIRKQFPSFLPKGVPIPNETIEQYFRSKLRTKSVR
jgi:uncharacterized phage-associated protein